MNAFSRCHCVNVAGAVLLVVAASGCLTEFDGHADEVQANRLYAPPLAQQAAVATAQEALRAQGVHEPLLPIWATEQERAQTFDLAQVEPGQVEAYAPTPPPVQGVARLPGEFEPVEEFLTVWHPAFGDYFTSIIAAAAPNAYTRVLVSSNNVRAQAQAALSAAGVSLDLVHFEVRPLNSIWMRDFGPLVVENEDGSRAAADFSYYNTRPADDRIPTDLGREVWGRLPARPGLKFEGGILQSNGQGTCVTTERLLLKNPQLSQAEVNDILLAYLGCEQVVYLPNLSGESTGHVDMFVHLTGPTEAFVGQIGTGNLLPRDYPVQDAAAWRAEQRANQDVLDEAAQRLSNAGFAVTRVPMPQRGPFNELRTYTNAIAVNDAVLVPVYNEFATEGTALSAYQLAYPGRTIIPIDARDVIIYGGAVHCTTMSVGAGQAPRGLGVRWEANGNGSWTFATLAPPVIDHVSYQVGGLVIGTADNDEEDQYALTHTLTAGQSSLVVRVTGYNANNIPIASATGTLDTNSQDRVFVRQVAAGIYEAGIETNAPNVTAVRVWADRAPLTDWYSGDVTVDEDGLLTAPVNGLRQRQFMLGTYNSQNKLQRLMFRTLPSN